MISILLLLSAEKPAKRARLDEHRLGIQGVPMVSSTNTAPAGNIGRKLHQRSRVIVVPTPFFSSDGKIIINNIEQLRLPEMEDLIKNKKKFYIDLKIENNTEVKKIVEFLEKNPNVYGAKFYSQFSSYFKNPDELDIAPILIALPNDLEELKLIRIKFIDEGFKNLRKFTQLETLSLENCFGIEFGPIQRLTQLTDLNLANTGLVLDTLWLDKLPKLKSLNLKKAQIIDANIAEIEHLTELETLNLEETSIFKGLANLARLPNIRTIYIKKANTRNSDLSIRRFKNMRPDVVIR